MHFTERISLGVLLKERIKHKVVSPSFAYLVVWACLSIFINVGHAAPVIQLDENSQTIDLSKYVDAFTELDAPLPSLNAAAQLLSPTFSNKFSPLDFNDYQQRRRIPDSDTPIWLRFVIDNNASQTSMYWLQLEQFAIQESTLYSAVITPNGLSQLNIVERYSNDFEEELFYRVNVAKNERKVFLFVADRGQASHFLLTLTRPHTVITDKTFEASHISTTLGMLILLSFLFSAVSVERKSKIFFYFAGYSTSLLAVISLSFFIKKNWFMASGVDLFSGIYFFAFLAGTCSLLLIRQYLLSLNCLKHFQQIIPLTMIVSAFFYLILSVVHERYNFYIWLPFLIILPVVVTALIHAYQRTQDQTALVIVFSRVIIAVPIIYLLLSESEKLSVNFLVHPIAMSILVLDLLLLGYCLYHIEDKLKLHSRKNKQLLHLNEVKHKAQQDVFSQLSQDLRTPISAIIGTAEILKSGHLDDDQANHVQGIEKSAHVVLNKITDIYHRTKSFQESEHVEMAPFEIHYLIEQCLESFSTDIKKRSLELIVDVDAQIEHVVVGHSFFLRTILVELIDNAVKGTSQGHIILRAEYINKVEGRIRFSIEDTGRGIETAHLEALNEPAQFARVSPEESGMNLVKQLLFQLDSKLTVESHIGEGCKAFFDVYLPASAMTISSKTFDASSLQAKRLLIIDDSHIYSRVLRSAANSWGLEATETYEGTEALALFRAKDNIGEPFDAIIIDNDIPNMPAVDVIKRVSETREDMPAVIMLAGFGAVPSMEVCKAVGIDIILNKPVSQRLIHSTLINLIESQQQQQSLTYSKTRVLIAEDNDVSRRVIGKMMDVLDVEYKLVSDGKLAVDAVKKEAFDVIIMDCEMPIMNGFDASQAIHDWQMENFSYQTPIYALTAHVFEEHEERSKKAGMQGFLEKPVQLTELSHLIEKHSSL